MMFFIKYYASYYNLFVSTVIGINTLLFFGQADACPLLRR